MSEAWVYIDESQAPSAEGCERDQPFWVGALSVEYPIVASLIDGAFTCLANDPDAANNQSDIRTLERGYFHASEDSPNAHSHICRAIVAARMNVQLRAFLWYFDREGGSSRKDSDLHRLGVLGSSLSTIDKNYDVVHLVVAKRGGSFEQRHADQWQAYCEYTLVEEAIEHGVPPITCLPTLELAEPSVPGIQVCDFVLWAAQRHLRGNSTWLQRLGMKGWANGGPEGEVGQNFALWF